MDVQFDEDEGKELEKESDEITQRIRILEIDLEPKPLPLLELSKPLEEYSWESLGETIIHMHHHITEQNLVRHLNYSFFFNQSFQYISI